MKSMRAELDKLRAKDPKLDRRLKETEPRRRLALALFGMRRLAKLTQKELGNRIKMDQAQISRMESATGPMPDNASISAYAKACAKEIKVEAAVGLVMVSNQADGMHATVVPVTDGVDDLLLIDQAIAPQIHHD